MTRQFLVRPAAQADITEAARWYERESRCSASARRETGGAGIHGHL